MTIRNQLRANGNMTNVEKQMNKDDLVAYKNYDNNQYSLVPGISTDKKIKERSRSNITSTEFSPYTISAKYMDNKYHEK